MSDMSLGLHFKSHVVQWMMLIFLLLIIELCLV
jgi:hypothetical protein